MHLLFLSTFYPPYELGGLDQLCQEVSEGLKRRGHHVTVLTSRYGTDEHSNDEVDVLRQLHLQAGLNYYRPIDFFLKWRQWEQHNAQALRAAIACNLPDLLVVWNMWNLSRNLPHWAETWLPQRVAYYVSSTWLVETDAHLAYWQLPARRALAEQLYKRPLRALALAELRRENYPPRLQLEHVMCVSRYIRDTLRQAKALPRDAGVLYNGIAPEPFLRHARRTEWDTPDRLRLLYFGALLEIKGVHTAVEALGILKGRGLADRIDLTLIGSGHPDYEARLHALVDQYGLQNSVHFAGRVARDKVPECLAHYDVYLFTSCGPEALARTVMEAMAAGLLVIGAETGGQVEMFVNGENSLTFKPEDAGELADQIERALDDPALRRRLAQAGQHTVLERFTLERMIDDTEAWLEQILHENTAPQPV
jgi:glycogen synthase